MGIKIKENYKSWFFKPEDFLNQKTDYEKLLFLVRFGILAPSSHNSQPWLFEVKEKTISVFKNKNARLKIGDPDDKLLEISLGCAIRNITWAAQAYGLIFSVIDVYKENYIIDITFESMTPKDPISIEDLELILDRSVNRTKYKKQSINSDLQNYINQKDTYIVTNSKEKEEVAELTNQAAIIIMDSKEFRKELGHYVKTNTTKAKKGIPAFGMGIPLIPSLIAPYLVQLFNMNKKEENKNKSLLVEGTPALCVVTTQGDSVKNRVEAGIRYEEIALTAERYGYKTAVWGSASVLLQTAESISTILGTKNNTQLLFRIGVPAKEQPHSPRMSLKDVLI